MARDGARVLNIGSINVDHVYAVEHFAQPGETLGSNGYRRFAGGKGFNQSVALARAGVPVRHAGCIGEDGHWLLERLRSEGIDTSPVTVCDAPTGHAIIQVAPSGENAIVLHGGANSRLTMSAVDAALAICFPGDWVLLQNETSAVAHAMAAAKGRGLRVAFNPAPMSPAVLRYPLEAVDLLIVNQTEARALTGAPTADAVCDGLGERLPGAAVLLTLGAAGAVYSAGDLRLSAAAPVVEAVDTTAAGDTFIGFFLATLMRLGDPGQSLDRACRAAALCVTRPGAADAIPGLDQL